MTIVKKQESPSVDPPDTNKDDKTIEAIEEMGHSIRDGILDELAQMEENIRRDMRRDLDQMSRELREDVCRDLAQTRKDTGRGAERACQDAERRMHDYVDQTVKQGLKKLDEKMYRYLKAASDRINGVTDRLKYYGYNMSGLNSRNDASDKKHAAPSKPSASKDTIKDLDLTHLTKTYTHRVPDCLKDAKKLPNFGKELEAALESLGGAKGGDDRQKQKLVRHAVCMAHFRYEAGKGARLQGSTWYV